MSFYSERTIKATRKRHLCDGCNQPIEVGSSAVRWAGMTDGDFGAAVYHPDCREAEVEMNRTILGYSYGDEWWPLHDIEREDRPWLVKAFPAVAARMGFIALSSASMTTPLGGVAPGNSGMNPNTSEAK